MVLPLLMNAGRAKREGLFNHAISRPTRSASVRRDCGGNGATPLAPNGSHPGFFHDQEQRFKQFVALAGRIRAILQPRIEALTEVNVFKDAKRSLGLERQGPEGRGLHEETITLSVPYSEECPAKVVLSFRVGHDGPIENAIINYELEILPIYIEFESHAKLLVPIDNPSDEAIAAWLDDRLVEFTRTYLELYFTDQYQKQSLETDPVMNIRFPRAFAAGRGNIAGEPITSTRRSRCRS